MGNTTPIVKWPYPVSSDLIAQGAVNIEQLAEAVEGQFFIPSAKFDETAPYTSYPVGISIMTGQSAGWGAPCQVVTYRITEGSWVTQYFTQRSSNTSLQTLKVRYGYSTSDGPIWSKWDTVAGPGSPDAMAGGNVTITPKADEVSSATVTFPIGRFQYAPAVFTQYRGGSPGVSTSPANVTNTSFTLNVLRATASSTYVYWLAVGNQGE